MKIKAPLLAAVLLGAGLTSCDTGTEPGETNVERSEIRYPEEEDRVDTGRYQDTTGNYEEIYEGRRGTSRLDSAGNQGPESTRERRYDDNNP